MCTEEDEAFLFCGVLDECFCGCYLEIYIQNLFYGCDLQFSFISILVLNNFLIAATDLYLASQSTQHAKNILFIHY